MRVDRLSSAGRRGRRAGASPRLRGSTRRALVAVVCGAAAAAALSAAPALAAMPVLSTGTATAVTYSTATLNGTVDPQGSATVVYFQVGTTSGYGSQSAPEQLPAGTAKVSVAIAISGLAAGTTYHYRIVATNASGTALGADRTLRSAKIPLSLAITGAPNPVVFGGAVTIEGTLAGTGSANAPVTLQANPFPYTAGFTDLGNPELTLANGTFAFNVLGASQNTEYRVVSGATASSDVVVDVNVAVVLHARPTGTRDHPTIRFGGTIAPAEPSARIAIERLIGTSWKVVGGTIAHASPVNGVVGFATTVRTGTGGFFRALVLPVEGGHVSGYSAVAQVRVR
jgi:hypothetical protein